ncbi:Like-Sm (LSM) domain-containing protein [Artemisia annua]|uniref:Like-Sm (LSM) domain-containing protein n=1 Tax=Artemisia annua TaxID=35608 RepID=A0A2U1KQF3_ARTAN|nr:Like-Sm (LSM) domain-containing protein [Artemisia annua]
MDDLEFHPIISPHRRCSMKCLSGRKIWKAEILNISRDISSDGVQQASIKMLEGTFKNQKKCSLKITDSKKHKIDSTSFKITMDDLEFHPIISAEILNISRDISGDGVQQASIKMLEGTIVRLFANQDTGKSENTASRISTQSKYSIRDDFLNKLLTKNIVELLDVEQVPKTDKGKKKALPVNKDRFFSKLFLCGDSVINVLRNPKSKINCSLRSVASLLFLQVIITALNALFVDKAGSKPLLLVRINIQCQQSVPSFFLNKRARRAPQLKEYEMGISYRNNTPSQNFFDALQVEEFEQFNEAVSIPEVFVYDY